MADDEDLVIPIEKKPRICAVDWLWEPYLAGSAVALLDGDPGVGKSCVALDLAARLTAGLPMPDGKPPPAASSRVLVSCAEDIVEQTVLPRFLYAGGVVDNLVLFGGLSLLRPANRLAQFPRDLKALFEQLRKTPCALAVLDPIGAMFPGMAANNDQAVRAHLAPFVRMAMMTGTCFLFLRHLNKSGRAKSLYRGSGTIGILGVARSGLLAGRHPDDPERRVLSVTKANLGSPGPSLGYRLGEREGRVGVIWEGPTNLTADDLCRGWSEDPAPGQQAEKLLHELLAKGPVPAPEAERAAAEAGIAFRTLQAAKQKLGVESRRVKRDGEIRWEWAWPQGRLPPLDPL